MTARMLAIGKWKAGDNKPVINTGHDNTVTGLDGKPLDPWDLERIFQEMKEAGELNPYPGDLDNLQEDII